MDMLTASLAAAAPILPPYRRLALPIIYPPPLLQSMCNLPYLFAPRLQQLVHRAVNFLAPAGRVRAAGRECLHAMVSEAGAGACV